jgi:hypothetical protein
MRVGVLEEQWCWRCGGWKYIGVDGLLRLSGLWAAQGTGGGSVGERGLRNEHVAAEVSETLRELTRQGLPVAHDIRDRTGNSQIRAMHSEIGQETVVQRRMWDTYMKSGVIY